MKTLLPYPLALAALAAFFFTTAETQARPVYGVSGPNGAAVRGTRGAVAVGDDRAAVATRRGVAVSGPNGTAVARRPVARPLPGGYIRTVPVGYRRVVYGGYNCYFVGGVYYRTVIYGGETVYVIVN